MKNNKTIIWIAAILVLGGGGFAFYRWWKNRPQEEQPSGSSENNQTPDTSTGGMSTGGTSGGASSNIATILDSQDKINTFRRWFIKNYPNAAKSISVDPTGAINSYVQKAWDTMDSKGFKVGDYYVKITTDWKPKYKVGDSVTIKGANDKNKTYKVTKVYPQFTKDANIVAPAYELVSGNEKIYRFL